MSLNEIKARKGIPQDKELLDHVGREELAANEFKATQTEAKLKRDRVTDEDSARRVHREIGAEIRNVIESLGGTKPEDLPAEEPIKAIERRVKKALPPPKD
jgi:DNA-damage-inducible protein D